MNHAVERNSGGLVCDGSGAGVDVSVSLGDEIVQRLSPGCCRLCVCGTREGDRLECGRWHQRLDVSDGDATNSGAQLRLRCSGDITHCHRSSEFAAKQMRTKIANVSIAVLEGIMCGDFGDVAMETGHLHTKSAAAEISVNTDGVKHGTALLALKGE